MKLISEFWKEEDAVGVKKQLVSLVNSLMEKVTNQSNTV